MKTAQILLIFLPLALQNVSSISQPCQQQRNSYIQALLQLQPWAWKMFDARSKFPSGILYGNVYDLGSFDECLDVDDKTTEILGQYCLGTIYIPLNQIYNNKPRIAPGSYTRTLGNNPQDTGIHFAVCLPDKCSANDATEIFIPHKFTETYCYTRQQEFKLGRESIVTISILGIFLLIVILSTGYDVFLYYTGIKYGNEIFVAFSWFTNGKKLLSTSSNSGQLLCLNGLKSISMIWIVAAHEYVNGWSGAVVNYIEAAKLMTDTANMFIIGSTVAVDTFFVIGGLVTVYTFIKATEKGVKFNIILYYIHRYLRLTPVLALVVLIHATLLIPLGSGPLWHSFEDHLVEPCKKHWWAALLYIQNYVHDEQACVPQSWYLSIDMQLFVLSPFILLPLIKRPKLTIIALISLTCLGIIIPFVISYRQELRAFMLTTKNDTQKYMFSYYEQTYCRFGAYIIGMMAGYMIHKMKTGQLRIKLNFAQAFGLWISSLAILVACVYSGHNLVTDEYNKWSHSLYIALSRPSWSVAVSVIIILCTSGFGGPINAFLSAPIFQMISKISYAIYLTHYELILMRAASYKKEVLFSHFTTFFNFWGDFMFSLALAIVLSLTFESPMIIIERLMFRQMKISALKTGGNV